MAPETRGEVWWEREFDKAHSITPIVATSTIPQVLRFGLAHSDLEPSSLDRDSDALLYQIVKRTLRIMQRVNGVMAVGIGGLLFQDEPAAWVSMRCQEGPAGRNLEQTYWET